jgi:hypothetical protein
VDEVLRHPGPGEIQLIDYASRIAGIAPLFMPPTSRACPSKWSCPVPRSATVRYNGFQKQHRIMDFAIIGFFRKTLEISGAKNVVIQFTVPFEEGSEYAELSITWS